MSLNQALKPLTSQCFFCTIYDAIVGENPPNMYGTYSNGKSAKEIPHILHTRQVPQHKTMIIKVTVKYCLHSLLTSSHAFPSSQFFGQQQS